MFCQSCGTALGDSSACPNCKTPVPAGAAPDVKQQLKTSSADAFTVVKKLLNDPIGGLATAYRELGVDRSLAAGIALSIGFAAVSSLGILSGASQWLGALGPFMGAPEGVGGFLSIVGRLLVVPASIIAVALGLRRLAGATPPIAADAFTVGASLVPLAVAILVSGMLGIRNFEIAAIVSFFAIVYLALMLFAGFTRVGGMSERAAAPAVPLSILLAGWLCKVFIGSMAGPFF